MNTPARKTTRTAIALMLVDSVVTALATVALAAGIRDAGSLNPLVYLSEWKILLGLCGFGIGLPLVLAAYRRGEMVVLFPLTSLASVWNVALAAVVLAETVSWLRGAGTLLIIAGSFAIAQRPAREVAA